VFTSFTLSQSGMAKHHLRLREPGWRSGLAINGIGALLSLLVLAIVATVKFTEGAWVIVLLVPIMVFGLVRLNKAYETELVELKADVDALATRPVMRRHAVVVLVDQLDAAVARAMQYARTLSADDVRAVHFDIDGWKTDQLTAAWTELGLARFPLDIVECPDRRIPRAALEMAADALEDGTTELTVLIPRREYTKVWHRMLHDRSSAGIADALDALPHCSVTIVPYHLGSLKAMPPAEQDAPWPSARLTGTPHPHLEVAALPKDRTCIGDLVPRQRAIIAGRIRSVRVQPWSGTGSLECTIADDTGSMNIVWYGRRAIGGIRVGTVVSVVGTVGRHRGRDAVLNPENTIISTPPLAEVPHDQHH
jgi:hypothetical protein